MCPFTGDVVSLQIAGKGTHLAMKLINDLSRQDDTTFEKQSSLFALAVADVLLINMWCHDIGREHAANKPLLKIVFQVGVILSASLRHLHSGGALAPDMLL